MDGAIKNISFFSRDLLAKSLWRALTVDCIWGSILKDKYFGSLSTVQWIWSEKKATQGISIIWAGLLSAFHVMADWLLGEGRHIQIGEDPLIGGPINFKLSPLLFLHLRNRGYHNLSHILVHNRSSVSFNVWLNAS